MQAVYDNHRKEFIMTRAKVNFRRLNMSLEGLRRLQVHCSTCTAAFSTATLVKCCLRVHHGKEDHLRRS